MNSTRKNLRLLYILTTMSDFGHRIVRLFEDIHPLERVPRAGYLLRGVTEPESVAAHSHFLALMALLVVEEYPERFDVRKVLGMALIHDLAEARLMDIPNPACTDDLKAAKDHAERVILASMLDGFPAHLMAWRDELAAGASPEARLIRGLDKAQMMVRVMMYGREGRGRLDEFWTNPVSFDDYGLEPVRAIFDALCRHAGRDRPNSS